MLIVNPVSGKGRVKGLMLDILSVLCAGGAPVTVFMTEKHGDATRFVVEYGEKFDRIACSGGDGTLSEVFSGLMRLPEERRPAVGYIPLGTTNDMAASLNIAKGPKNAIAQLGDSFQLHEPRTIDIGSLGPDYFGYVAAFGVFTDITFTTPQEAKNTWGYLAYLTEAIGRLGQLNSVHLKLDYDEGSVEGDFLLGMVVNSTRVGGGFVKFPEEDVALDDGIFELLLLRRPKRLGDLSVAASQILRREFNTENVLLLHTKKAHFEFDCDVQWTRDGEDGGVYRTVDVVNYQRAVRIFV